MRTILLRDLVENRLEAQWAQWSRRHPHLAEIIDRTRLIETTVTSVTDDPQLEEAFRQADLDEHQLEAAFRLMKLVERLVGRALRL